MAHQLMLPTAALLSLIGAGIGVHLGNGAIDAIDPAYFDSDQPRSAFYADLAPDRSRDWGAVQVRELRAAESGVGLGTGCVGCRAYPEEYYPVHEASLGKAETGWAEVAEAPAEPEAPIAEPMPQPEPTMIERYAIFPVTAEEQQEREAQAPAATYASVATLAE